MNQLHKTVARSDPATESTEDTERADAAFSVHSVSSVANSLPAQKLRASMRSICMGTQLQGMIDPCGNNAANRRRRRWNNAINRSRGSGGWKWKLNSHDSVIAVVPQLETT